MASGMEKGGPNTAISVNLITQETVREYLMIFKYHLRVLIFLNTENTTVTARQVT